MNVDDHLNVWMSRFAADCIQEAASGVLGLKIKVERLPLLEAALMIVAFSGPSNCVGSVTTSPGLRSQPSTEGFLRFAQAHVEGIGAEGLKQQLC